MKSIVVEVEADLILLEQEADLPPGTLTWLYNALHHHYQIVTIQDLRKKMGLDQEMALRAFRLASLEFEAWTEGESLYHLPDLSERLSLVWGVDPLDVAMSWRVGVQFCQEVETLFDGNLRGKELKRTLEHTRVKWLDRLPGKMFDLFLTLAVANSHMEESVSPARYALKKVME